MPTRIYHWKHGWIPLDHAAASEKNHGKSLAPVSRASLPRADHVVAGHSSSTNRFVVYDTRTKKTTTIGHAQASELQSGGHSITEVHAGGVFATRKGRTTQRHSSETPDDVAGRLVDDATRAEKGLTSLMKRLADRHRGKLEGLDFRLKTKESLSRKIAAEVRDDPTLSPTEAGDKMFDINRYTTTFDHARYATEAQAAITELRAAGYAVKVKNYWLHSDNPYQGINMQIVSPDGQKFELQFHTAESLSIKEGKLHTLYEEFRVSTDPKKRERLVEEMHRISRGIPVPPGVAKVK